jgi:hypothetical protein
MVGACMHMRLISILMLLVFFLACDGGINSITVGIGGKTYFNPPINPSSTSILPISEDNNKTNKEVQAELPNTEVKKPLQKEIQIVEPIEKINIPVKQAQPTNISILDSLGAKTSTVTLTERESIGMPRVNGERIEAEIYSDNILIVKYLSNLSKVRYSDEISAINTLGEVQDNIAKTPYPISFIKIYFTDNNGDVTSKIFGVVK